MGLRKDSVRKETRRCVIHGDTEFACYVAGSKDSPVNQWVCMKCSSKRTAQRARDRKAGIPPLREPNKKPEKLREQCPECFTELPATRICDCGYIPKEKKA